MNSKFFNFPFGICYSAKQSNNNPGEINNKFSGIPMAFKGTNCANFIFTEDYENMLVFDYPYRLQLRVHLWLDLHRTGCIYFAPRWRRLQNRSISDRFIYSITRIPTVFTALRLLNEAQWKYKSRWILNRNTGKLIMKPLRVRLMESSSCRVEFFFIFSSRNWIFHVFFFRCKNMCTCGHCFH